MVVPCAILCRIVNSFFRSIKVPSFVESKIHSLGALCIRLRRINFMECKVRFDPRLLEKFLPTGSLQVSYYPTMRWVVIMGCLSSCEQ